MPSWRRFAPMPTVDLKRSCIESTIGTHQAKGPLTRAVLVCIAKAADRAAVERASHDVAA